MSMTGRNGGSKLSRSETVTVRLDPMTRYLAVLAGRNQRRTLSSYIEWAIQSAIAAEGTNILPTDEDGILSAAEELAKAAKQLGLALTISPRPLPTGDFNTLISVSSTKLQQKHDAGA